MKESFSNLAPKKNIHLEVLKAKEMAHEIPKEMLGGVENAIRVAKFELENKGRLSLGTKILLKRLYKLMTKLETPED